MPQTLRTVEMQGKLSDHPRNKHRELITKALVITSRWENAASETAKMENRGLSLDKHLAVQPFPPLT